MQLQANCKIANACATIANVCTCTRACMLRFVPFQSFVDVVTLTHQHGFRVKIDPVFDTCGNISTMLIGRGTLATHDWGLRVDGAGQPYIPVGAGKSYMVEMGKDYQLQQEECARKCAGQVALEETVAAVGCGETGCGETPKGSPGPSEPEPTDPPLGMKHLPELEKARSAPPCLPSVKRKCLQKPRRPPLNFGMPGHEEGVVAAYEWVRRRPSARGSGCAS